MHAKDDKDDKAAAKDVDAEFRGMVDSFIDLANTHCEAVQRENVSMALLYAAARFNSFVVAAHAPDVEKYESDRSTAMEFFSKEYRKMLAENLDDYKRIYAQGPYAHLMKSRPT